MSIKVNVMFLLFISAIFGAFNFEVFFMGQTPTETQGFISLSFVFLWLIYGFITSFKKIKYFLIFITLYWCIGLLLTLIVCLLQWYILIIPLTCIYFAPLDGLRYFFKVPIDGNFFYFAIFLSYLVTVFGCFLGKLTINKPTSKK